MNRGWDFCHLDSICFELPATGTQTTSDRYLSELLQRVLSYHVVPGRVTANQLPTGTRQLARLAFILESVKQ